MPTFAKWHIKPNLNKSVHTAFILCYSFYPSVFLLNVPIPMKNTVGYVGIDLDKRLTWNSRIRIKRLALNSRLRSVRTLLTNNKHSKLIVKVFEYKTFSKPLWTSGIRLWGTEKVSNTNKIQQFQNIALRKIFVIIVILVITNATSFVSNYTLREGLSIKTASKEAAHFYKRFHDRLQSHHNPLAKRC